MEQMINELVDLAVKERSIKAELIAKLRNEGSLLFSGKLDDWNSEHFTAIYNILNNVVGREFAYILPVEVYEAKEHLVVVCRYDVYIL